MASPNDESALDEGTVATGVSAAEMAAPDESRAAGSAPAGAEFRYHAPTASAATTVPPPTSATRERERRDAGGMAAPRTGVRGATRVAGMPPGASSTSV